MPKNTKAALLVLSSAILFLYVIGFFNNGDLPFSRSVADQNLVKDNSENLDLNVKLQSKKIADRRDFLEKKRKSLALKSSFGLKTLKSSSRSKINIKLEISPKLLWCQAGELENIDRILRGLSDDRLLVTIENSNSRSRPLFSKIITASSLSKKQSFEVSIPANEDPQSLDIQICSVKRNSEVCSGKKIISYKEMQDALLSSSPALKSDDFVFVYQNLLLEGANLHSYSNTKRANEDAKRLINALANNIGISKNDLVSSWRKHKKLGSLPLEMEKDRVRLFVTQNDPRCSVR